MLRNRRLSRTPPVISFLFPQMAASTVGHLISYSSSSRNHRYKSNINECIDRFVINNNSTQNFEYINMLTDSNSNEDYQSDSLHVPLHFLRASPNELEKSTGIPRRANGVHSGTKSSFRVSQRSERSRRNPLGGSFNGSVPLGFANLHPDSAGGVSAQCFLAARVLAIKTSATIRVPMPTPQWPVWKELLGKHSSGLLAKRAWPFVTLCQARRK
ncbi:hypothetical protein CEXT_181411 [Caerostris extrusa]|uniref:Uncharacterized protein n=1 Tax=Caerostris extrusa TaxID=172846 RepID=A0AAV4T6N5_CAEEX|nr:hypothetical protein CEXT_181411 [Caerostris extrusa]